MRTNPEIARRFREIAWALELLDLDPFRARAYRRGARAVSRSSVDLVRVVETAGLEGVCRLPDIGRALGERVVEFVETGAIGAHRELCEKVPAGLFVLLELPGLGPKAVSRLWRDLGVTDPGALVSVIESGAILTLPRMGAKAVERLRRTIELHRRMAGWYPMGLVAPLAQMLVESIVAVPGVERAAVAGDLRRGVEMVREVVLVVAAVDAGAVDRALTGRAELRNVEGRLHLVVPGRREDGIRLEVVSVVPERWGVAMVRATGPSRHVARLASRARERGLSLDTAGDGGLPTEESVYGELDLPWRPPELREHEGDRTDPEELVVASAICSELHCHTDASDGRLSLSAMVDAAASRGLHTIGITDHSQSAVVANGLSPERLRDQVKAIRALASARSDVELLAGAEVDILADGRLDYGEELLEELDLVVASVHLALQQSPAAATERLVRAVCHPRVHVLGHPTGRILGRRDGLEPDFDAVFAAAAAHGVALEVNANWRRLDLSASLVERAIEAGCLIAINTDAHHEDDLDNLAYGIVTARRGGCPASRCVNTWSRERLRAWLADRRSAVPS